MVLRASIKNAIMNLRSFSFSGWWDSGSDGTLNRQHSHQPTSTKNIPNQQSSDKLQRSGSTAASPSPRSMSMVPGVAQRGNPGSPASTRQSNAGKASPSGLQQQKRLGRINLQNFSNVTDSISSKFVGRKTSDKTVTGQATASQAAALQQDKQCESTTSAPLATPESIELGAEYMTVKVGNL